MLVHTFLITSNPHGLSTVFFPTIFSQPFLDKQFCQIVFFFFSPNKNITFILFTFNLPSPSPTVWGVGSWSPVWIKWFRPKCPPWRSSAAARCAAWWRSSSNVGAKWRTGPDGVERVATGNGQERVVFKHRVGGFESEVEINSTWTWSCKMLLEYGVKLWDQNDEADGLPQHMKKLLVLEFLRSIGGWCYHPGMAPPLVGFFVGQTRRDQDAKRGLNCCAARTFGVWVRHGLMAKFVSMTCLQPRWG